MKGLVFKGFLVASSALAGVLAPAAGAQTTQPAAARAPEALTEVVVTARRRDELSQNVPMVIDAVPAQEIDKLNLRELKDISSIVPGLNLTTNANGIGAAATLRGVNFDVNASGNNGTVEFYLNDEPITSNVVLQSMYDISQIEVLRGPQGTLRGRASPSGSITVTTTRPNLYTYGGYVTETSNNQGGTNANGAVNLPLINGKLAVRVAGLVDDNEANQVQSLNDPRDHPYSRTHSERLSVRFDPIDNLDINVNYQHLRNSTQVFDQVESANYADPTQASSAVAVTPDQRASVENTPRRFTQDYKVYNLQAEYFFAGQRLNYVGAYSEQVTVSGAPNDVGDAFGYGGYPGDPQAANDPLSTGSATKANLLDGAQVTWSLARQQSHELRLSSDERLFGRVDYVLGALYLSEDAPVNLWSETPIFLGPPSPATFLTVFPSNTTQTGAHSSEKSIFANATVHLTDATEISGGLRGIDYADESTLTVKAGATTVVPRPRETFHPMIYSASLKHRFSPNIMAYFSTGTSWRASAQTNRIIDSLGGHDLYSWGYMSSLLQLAPETSTSYEGGVKTDWFDRRLQLDLTLFHQDFDNYFYSSPKVQVAQRSALGGNCAGAGTASQGTVCDTYSLDVESPALAVGVPVQVNGVEGQFAYRPLPRWTVGGSFSYTISQIEKGKVPCNLPGAPTAAEIVAATGQQVASCIVNYRAGVSPPGVLSLQSEYYAPLTNRADGFVRGLLTTYSDSQNDPANRFDNVDAYTILNLYFGVRDPHNTWVVTAYVKNLLDMQRVLTRDASPLVTAAQNLATGVSLPTGYREITMTPPQEIGVNFKLTFGSR